MGNKAQQNSVKEQSMLSKRTKKNTAELSYSVLTKQTLIQIELKISKTSRNDRVPNREMQKQNSNCIVKNKTQHNVKVSKNVHVSKRTKYNFHIYRTCKANNDPNCRSPREVETIQFQTKIQYGTTTKVSDKTKTQQNSVKMHSLLQKRYQKQNKADVS